MQALALCYEMAHCSRQTVHFFFGEGYHGAFVELPVFVGKGAAGAQLVEELKKSDLSKIKRAMEGLDEIALLMEYLDIYGVLDKVRATCMLSLYGARLCSEYGRNA